MGSKRFMNSVRPPTNKWIRSTRSTSYSGDFAIIAAVVASGWISQSNFDFHKLKMETFNFALHTKQIKWEFKAMSKKKLCSFVRFQCTINAWWQCRLPKYQTLSLSDTCCMSYYLICNNSRVSLRSVLLLFYFAFFRLLPIYLFINTQSNPHKKKKRQKRKKRTIYNTEHTSVARHQ